MPDNTGKKSTYRRDSEEEKILAGFLDRYFYGPLSKRESLTVSRVYDAELQRSGADVMIIREGRKSYIDEKAAMHWANTNLTTFAFELEFHDQKYDGTLTGWLFKEGQKTDCYFLMWPNIMADTKKEGKPVKNLKAPTDFLPFEAMFIRKRTLLERLNETGYTEEKLEDLIAEIKTEYEINGTKSIILTHDMRIQYSPGYAERPVNLIISRKMLKEIAEATFYIGKDGYARLR